MRSLSLALLVAGAAAFAPTQQVRALCLWEILLNFLLLENHGQNAQVGLMW